MLTREQVDEEVRALQAKRITPNEYLRRTRGYWDRIAGRIYRCWRGKLGTNAGRDDVAQLFLIQVLKHSLMWDPARDVPPTRYILTPSERRTLRKMDSLRGASLHGNSNANPSRPETPFARFARPAGAEGAEIDPCDFRPTRPNQEAAAAYALAFGDAGETQGSRFLLAALRECRGDLDGAALALYESETCRLALELTSLNHARKLVGTVARFRLRAELASRPRPAPLWARAMANRAALLAVPAVSSAPASLPVAKRRRVVYEQQQSSAA